MCIDHHKPTRLSQNGIIIDVEVIGEIALTAAFSFTVQADVGINLGNLKERTVIPTSSFQLNGD